jgi:hypothetical protein
MVTLGADFLPRHKAGGRPTLHTEALAERICAYIEAGNSLKSACKLVGLERSTVTAWAIRNPDFRARYFEAFPARISLRVTTFWSWRTARRVNKHAHHGRRPLGLRCAQMAR